MIIKIENGQPVGYPILEENFRMLFPSITFPLIFTPQIVEAYGYGMYDFSQKPEADWDKKVVESAPVQDQYGIWRQTWAVESPTVSELTALIELQKSRLISTIDGDVDVIYGKAVGNRVTEYQLAELEAQQYKDAGYTGTVPESVSGWATAKNWTATQAADDILLQALQWRTVQKVIRNQRLQAKERVKSATTVTALNTEAATWSQTVNAINSQLGIA